MSFCREIFTLAAAFLSQPASAFCGSVCFGDLLFDQRALRIKTQELPSAFRSCRLIASLSRESFAFSNAEDFQIEFRKSLFKNLGRGSSLNLELVQARELSSSDLARFSIWSGSSLDQIVEV